MNAPGRVTRLLAWMGGHEPAWLYAGAALGCALLPLAAGRALSAFRRR